MVVFDAVLIATSSVCALLARFDFSYQSIEAMYLSHMYDYLPIHIVLTILVFYFCRMYHSLWKFVGVQD